MLSFSRRCIPKNVIRSRFFCASPPMIEERKINTQFRIFMEQKPINFAKLENFLNESSAHLTSFNIVFLFSLTQKAKVNFPNRTIFKLAELLATRKDVLTATDASICMYTMRTYPRDSQAHKLMGVVADKLENSAEVFTSEMISNSMNGLRNMSSKNPSISRLLITMRKKIAESPDQMTPAHLSSAFYGMKSMSLSSSPKHCTVLPIINALSDKLLQCKGEWKPWEVGNAMLGLQLMNSENEIVRKPVNSLSLILKQGFYNLDSRSLCNILVGLRNMTSDHAEVRYLVQRVAEKVDVSSASDPFDSIAVGNSINGLSRMQCKHPQVRNLVKKLSAKVAQCQETIEHRHLAMAMYGMRNLTSDFEEVRELIAIMAQKLSMAKHGMMMNDLTKVFSSLEHCSTTHAEVRQLITAIDGIVENANFSELHTGQVVSMIYSMSSVGSSSQEARELIAKLSVLSRASNGLPFSAVDIAKVIQGMALMDPAEDQVKELFAAVVLKTRSLTNADDVILLRKVFVKTFGTNIVVSSVGNEVDIMSSKVEELENLITALDLNQKRKEDDYLSVAADLFKNSSPKRN